MRLLFQGAVAALVATFFLCVSVARERVDAPVSVAQAQAQTGYEMLEQAFMARAKRHRHYRHHRRYTHHYYKHRRHVAGHRSVHASARASSGQTKQDSSGMNIFDVLGMAPTPFDYLPIESPLGSMGASTIGSASIGLLLQGASTALREHREMSNSEACQVVFGALPIVGMLPIGEQVCKYPDTCYNPEYVTYVGLRNDDPVGRFGRWVRWMKKYCPDVNWHQYAPRAQAYIDSTTQVP